MEPFLKQIIILFLIFTIVLFSFSVQTAEAGEVFSFNFIFNIINVITNFLVGSIEIFLGDIFGIDSLISDGSCRLENQNDTPFLIYSDECGISGITITAPMLIPGVQGECRVGLALPSFYEPWAGKSLAVKTSASTQTIDGYTDTIYTYTNYFKDAVMEKQDINLNPSSGILLSYRLTPAWTTQAISATSSLTTGDFRIKYGEIILEQRQVSGLFRRTETISTSTPEQFISSGTSLGKTQYGDPLFRVTGVSDISTCAPSRFEEESSCLLYFTPKGTTNKYEIQSLSLTNSYSYKLLPPLDQSEYDVELYRFTLAKPEGRDANNVELRNWLLPGDYDGSNQAAFNRTAGLGVYRHPWNRFERKSYTRKTYIYNYYPSSPDAEQTTPIFTAKYKNVCASGICNLVDSNPIEGKYLAYEAKIKGDFGEFYSYLEGRARSGLFGFSQSEEGIVPAQAKYLNTQNTSTDSKFSTFMVDDGDLIYNQTGNIIYGPLAPITLPDPDSCVAQANVRITAISCDSVTILTTVPFADQAEYSGYDVYRDGKLLAFNIPITQSVYEDKNLSQRTEYTYKVVVKTTDGMNQDYNLPAVKTVCVPECYLSASPNTLVYPQGQTSLSWGCQSADSCLLSATNLPKNYSTQSQFCSSSSAMEGMSETINNACQVSPSDSVSSSLTLDQTTTFILNCQNIDGYSTDAATVELLRPRRIEVVPR